MCDRTVPRVRVSGHLVVLDADRGVHIPTSKAACTLVLLLILNGNSMPIDQAARAL